MAFLLQGTGISRVLMYRQQRGDAVVSKPRDTNSQPSDYAQCSKPHTASESELFLPKDQ